MVSTPGFEASHIGGRRMLSQLPHPSSITFITIYLISPDAELLSECSIDGLERDYQKYNVLSTEDLTRHFTTM